MNNELNDLIDAAHEAHDLLHKSGETGTLTYRLRAAISACRNTRTPSPETEQYKCSFCDGLFDVDDLVPADGEDGSDLTCMPCAITYLQNELSARPAIQPDKVSACLKSYMEEVERILKKHDAYTPDFCYYRKKLEQEIEPSPNTIEAE